MKEPNYTAERQILVYALWYLRNNLSPSVKEHMEHQVGTEVDDKFLFELQLELSD